MKCGERLSSGNVIFPCEQTDRYDEASSHFRAQKYGLVVLDTLNTVVHLKLSDVREPSYSVCRCW